MFRCRDRCRTETPTNVVIYWLVGQNALADGCCCERSQSLRRAWDFFRRCAARSPPKGGARLFAAGRKIGRKAFAAADQARPANDGQPGNFADPTAEAAALRYPAQKGKRAIADERFVDHGRPLRPGRRSQLRTALCEPVAPAALPFPRGRRCWLAYGLQESSQPLLCNATTA